MEITFCLTTKCNGSCSYCERKKDYVPKNLEMSTEVIEKCPPADKISFTGSAGDAIFHNGLFKIIEIVRRKNPDVNIRFSTNGSINDKDWWKELARLMGKNSLVAFAIDSIERKCLYRGLNPMDQLQRMKWYKEFNENLTWQFIPFGFNEERIVEMKLLAKEIGVNFYTKTFRKGLTYSHIAQCRNIDMNWYYVDESNRVHPCCHLSTYLLFDHKLNEHVFEYLNQDVYLAYLQSKDLIDLEKSNFKTAINSPYFKMIQKYNKRLNICQKCQPTCG